MMADLYRAHASAIYARCNRILRDPAAAEDASQETFIRVLRHPDKAPPSSEVRQWMCRIAINLCLNALRDARARYEDNISSLDNLPALACPEQAIIDRDLIRRVIGRAPISVRGAARLYHVEGLGQHEVASELGVSRRTVVYRLATFSHHLVGFLEQEARSSTTTTAQVCSTGTSTTDATTPSRQLGSRQAA